MIPTDKEIARLLRENAAVGRYVRYMYPEQFEKLLRSAKGLAIQTDREMNRVVYIPKKARTK